jgi:uncharacterized protein
VSVDPTLGIDPRLLEILACPCEHHAPVEPVTSGAAAPALSCTRCHTTFPVRHGIPVMLLDEATPGPGGIGNPA